MTTTDPLKSLSRIDLNLLVTLHALLETNSTTHAAININRTQSAVSIALGRLRAFFNDPLFIRHGPTLTPTEFALQLRYPLSRIMCDVATLANSGVHFDPLTSDRQITLAIPDIAQTLITSIVNGLRRDAPNIKIVMADSSLEITDYSEGIKLLLAGKIDLLMSFYTNDAPQGVHVERLESQTWSVFARPQHPISDQPSLKEWASYEHIQIASGAKGRTPVTDSMANINVKRNIALKVNSFLQALHTVGESNLLLTTMTPLATPIAQALNLREIPLPLDVPCVPFCLMTRSIEHDGLSAWLLKKSLKYARSVAP